MPTVQSFASIIHARRAADYLISRAIMARVVAASPAFGAGACTIEVIDKVSAERARELLQEWGTQKLYSPDPGWEEQARPDLSRLAPGTRAPCPSCGRDLPLDTRLTACPHCGAPVDVAEVLVARLGPDALAACYVEEAPDIPEEVVQGADIACPACGYLLKGLAPTGICPECGRPYSKVDILRRGSA